MSYTLGFDGVLSVETRALLRSVENRLNGIGLQTQTAGDSSASAVTGASAPQCQPGQSCTSGEKGGQDLVIVIVVAAVTGAVAGYIAGKMGTSGEKGGQD